MSIISVRTGHPQQKASRRLLLIGQTLYPIMHPAAPALLHSGDVDQGHFTNVLKRLTFHLLTTTCFLGRRSMPGLPASRSPVGFFFFGGDASSYVLVPVPVLVLVLVLVLESCVMMDYFLRASLWPLEGACTPGQRRPPPFMQSRTSKLCLDG